MKTTNPMRARASVKAMPRNIVVRTMPADSGWRDGVRVAVGAQTVFEPDPPFVDNRAGFAANRVFALGRVLYLNLHKDFGL